MKITATVNESEMRKTLRKLEKATGGAIEQGIDIIASEGSKGLAAKCQPWGLSAKVGRKYQANIEKQVTQVYLGINAGIYQDQGGLERTHQALRRRGRIRERKITKSMWRGWKQRIPRGDLPRYVAKQQAKAGRVKAGWISAGINVTKRKPKGVGAWVSKHISSRFGVGRRVGRGISAIVELENRVPYARSHQSSREVAAGLRLGRSMAVRTLRKEIDNALKSVAR